jgi:beta-glucanase (GH16 family)|eukprot:COSAG01_NODE_2385_length_7787_cov_62.523023_7_plen_283_part_00
MDRRCCTPANVVALPLPLVLLLLSHLASSVDADSKPTAWEIPYTTNFSTIDPAMWAVDQGCFSCKAPKDPETVFECTNNTVSALRPGSITRGSGLTIVTTRQSNGGMGCSPAPAGGTSGHLSSKQPFHFGTLRVKSRYFPGRAEQVSTAKGFIGLEDPKSGAITITMHGAGGSASGAPPGADWTHFMQSSCYQHGDDHTKTFTDLGAHVNAAEEFNLFEIDWRPSSVTISVNGVVARRVSGASHVPQKPLYARLHARSTEYHSMAEGSSFQSFLESFSFTPA